MKMDKCEELTESGLKLYVVEYQAFDGLFGGFALIQTNNPEQIKGILRAESNLNAYGDIKVLSIEEIVYSITPKLIIEKYYEN